LRPGLLAHRGLHSEGVPENSLPAFEAALAKGYGIELDVQLSADGVAMVFHDDGLGRMTELVGPVRALTAAELGETPLRGGGRATIPTLTDALALIGGKVPVLIEIKDQDGALGDAVEALEEAVADVLWDYNGPVAVMSFNPHSVALMAELSPQVSRGLVTCAYLPDDWEHVPETRRAELRAMPDIARVGAAFLSHDMRDLDNPKVADLKAAGLPILCWTIRSAEEEAKARQSARAITFEGYLP
jgi:glycerophosphoryl diester phosphodiesterase